MTHVKDIDYGFITINMIDKNGEYYTSSLIWHKDSPNVTIVGHIPPNHKCVITHQLIEQLKRRCLK
jgi:hypothetical protein